MKIDPHAALLAAQNLRTQDNAARGREASANFFAELKKASTQQQRPASTLAAANTTSARQESTRASTSFATHSGVREAPLRQADPSRPMPPGSLLNILV